MTEWFASPLSWWQWLAFAAIPPAIVALYFLKLKRQPLQVPSTYLWHQALEDLHVNSLWQRLRQSLLLLLQLLLIGLLMLACLRPGWTGGDLVEDRVILLIDTSASMSATDVSPSRLEEAKQQALTILDRMQARDAAMIISFSDRARVEQPFTTDQRALRRRLQAIQPTQRASDISEALHAAAGLANPGRSGETSTADVPVADPMPAEVFVFSDGRFRTVPDVSWGNLRPRFISVGRADAANVGIVAFRCETLPGRTDKLQAIVQVENFGNDIATAELSLLLDDQLLDASRLTIEPGKVGGVEFTLDRPEQASLRVMLAPDDDFSLDNSAYAVVNRAQRPRVLLVSPSGTALQTALSTDESLRTIELHTLDPQGLNDAIQYQQPAAEGMWELIIFDNCQPQVDPAANTLYFDALPPHASWNRGERVSLPQLVDVDVSHPIMSYIDLNNVTIVASSVLQGPPGSRVLVDADAGPVCMIGPRQAFEDLVLGFGLEQVEESGIRSVNTDWPIRLSFPIFVRNVLQYLGRVAETTVEPTISVGDTIAIRSEQSGPLTITSPDGSQRTVVNLGDRTFPFQDTDQVGVYTYPELPHDPTRVRLVAVNLFDPVESNIRPLAQLETAWNTIEAQASLQSVRREFWRWLALMALAVLAFEWYVYNRRAYL